MHYVILYVKLQSSAYAYETSTDWHWMFTFILSSANSFVAGRWDIWNLVCIMWTVRLGRLGSRLGRCLFVLLW